ncbi:hypothetical protein VSR01_10950 [Actinacidiphila sp. DG2A-62]|uniref:hypothetical protein n=1 Tax=Actinacidiphila sp. DG2A-62 TaxID=3108821 RepID=UPI002DB7E52E|nr:hypothetical protein [Actinacidiphila sp. DG2A-62]MEC3994037.1 hypothetical protein [Actinacidiphila sp. DG2A-62]
MTAPTDEDTVVGLCNCCDQPVHEGDERWETVHRGTGAAPDMLLHRRPCQPAESRRFLGRSRLWS